MKRLGSQLRATLAEAGYQLVSRPEPGLVILENIATGNREFWGANDRHAGYTIQVGRWGYEYLADWRWSDK